MKAVRTIGFGLFSIIIGVVILLQFVTISVEEIELQGIGIILEPYDGEISTREIEYSYGTPISDLPEPNKIGYDFMGWYLDENHTIPIEPGDTVDERVTLYAKYSPLNYIIHYLDDDILIYTEEYAFNDIIDFPDLTKEGHSFVGWYLDSDLENLFDLETMPSTNLTLHGKWVIDQYTITFETNGGLDIAPITDDYGSLIDTEIIPTREGYSFSGWYSDSALTESYEIYDIPSADITLYAKWGINLYTVHFEENGGDIIQNHYYNFNDTINLPSSPVREGYTFSGWYLDAGLTTSYNLTTMPANHLTVYAKWDVNQYTITYSPDGGTTIETISLDYGDTVSMPPDPTKAGYTFGGWYTDEDLTNRFIGTTMPSSNTTLYAKWLINEYVIDFVDYNGNVLKTSTHNLGDDLSTVLPPNNPTRTGYTFTGWDQLLPNNMPDHSIVVLAEYTINTYDIDFVDYDGTIIQTNSYIYNTDTTGLVNPDNPTRTGYTFTGWDNSIPFVMPANDVTINANYQANTYYIYFFDYDNSLLYLEEVDYGADLTGIVGPETPERVGYSFVSWDTTLPATMPANHISLVATYSVVKYTITFDSNGGTPVNDLESQEGMAIFAPTPPTKLGYIFDGWFIDTNLVNEFEFLTTPPRDITLYAKWIPDTFTLEYQDYNGTVLYSNDFEYGTSLSSVVIPNNPTRVGYTFSGWDTILPSTMTSSDLIIKATYTVNNYTVEYLDYDGTVIQTGQFDFSEDLTTYVLPSNPSRIGYTFTGWNNILPVSMPANDIIITAQYAVNQYTITFNSNGGTLVSAITQDYNTSITNPLDPIKTGYTFNGWFSDANFINQFVFNTMPADDLTLYAKWTINQYTISFDTDGGTVLPAITQDYLSPVVAPNAPVKEGYTFTGWDVVVPNSMPGQDITITATYVVNIYTMSFEDWDGTVIFEDDIEFAQDLSSLAYPSDPTRNGYTFTGWDTSIPATMPANDLVVTAEYNVNIHVLEFVDYNGDLIQSNNYGYGTNLNIVNTPSDPTRVGYTFTGWDTLVPETMPDNDITITAEYSINQYTISFVSNGGLIISPIIQNYNTSVIEPAEPTRLGYTFNGWYMDAGLTQSYTFSTMPAQNTTLYAKWTINQYIISFNTDGGTIIPNIVQDYGSNISTPTNPVKEGYTFTGWDISIPSTMPANNVIITAQYSINQYTLRFEDYDGSLINETSFNYNEDLSLVNYPADPSRTGYTFTGWSSSVPSTMPASNITITAEYSVNQYYIEYLDYDGSQIRRIYYDYGENLNLVTAPADPIRNGYTFIGWDTSIPTNMPNNNITINATYNVNQYIISFYSNGGTSVSSITDDFDVIITQPSNPTKTGYTFNGWYSDAGLTQSYTFTTMPSENLSLYAKWTINQYTISFEENGGTTVSDITQNYNTSLTEPTDPTRTGYTFNGWYTDDVTFNNAYTFTTMPANSITLYADWTINQYTLEFEDWDGTVLQTADYDYGTDLSAVTAPAVPSRTGYTFTGWNTSIPATMPANNITITAVYSINQYTIRFEDYDGSLINETSYDYNEDLSLVNNPTDPIRTGYTFTGWDSSIPVSMPNNNIVITAQYTINQYTISFQSNGGTLVSDITQNYNTAVSQPSNPTKIGYTFNGWYSDAGLTQSYTFSTMPAQNITLYADWTINQYTISFNSDGGTLVSDITQNYNTAVSQPSNPTKTGYTFGGWYSDAGLTQSYTFTTMPAQNITLYAKWTINQYTISFEENGGTTVSDITQNYNISVTQPTDPTRTGYTFNGWYTDDVTFNNAYTFTTMPANSITLYADWTVNQYTLEFVDWDGTVLQTADYDYGTDLSAVTAPADPSRTGYTFTGWDSSIPATMPANNITITAVYSINQYTLEFVDWDGTVLQTADYNYGANLSGVNTPADPSRTGYTFTGWNSSIPATMPAIDVTITAIYTINQYTISFQSNGGTSVSDITQNYNTAVSQPSNPTKTGYTFGGWYSDAGLTQSYTFTTMPANNLTLYAKWTINQYTISFEENGGTTVSDITQNYNTSVTQPSNPTRTGYTFGGWYSDITLTTPYTFTTMPAQNTTIYAKWTVNQYTLEFVDWDGTVLQTADYDYGTDLSAVTAPADPSRTGYTFTGWDSSIPATMPANNITITAVYSINQYTLEFVDWDGTVLQTADYNYGANLSGVNTPADPSRTGYTFTGWNSSIPATMPAIDVTITAIYTINQYTISFQSNGGTSVSDITQNYNTAVSQPSNPTKTGYTFGGWYSDAGLTQSYTFTTMPAQNNTLYAKWTINQYTISFNSNGGTSVSSIQQNYGSDVTPPTEPTKTSYIFGGWYTDNTTFNNEYSFSTMPASNITLYAKWNASDYTITFDSNGGTAVGSITQAHGTSVSAPADPTRAGYTFSGWYTDDVTFNNAYTFTTMPSNNLTLYAKWTVNQYTITFNSNGGSSVSSITQNYNTSVSQPTDPAKTGYIFDGWYTDNTTFNNLFIFDTMPSSDITVYAKWITDNSTISFNSNGGTSVSDITQQAGTAVTQPSNPTKTGYTFNGWYSDYALTNAYTFSTMPTDDLTLYAKWSVIQYTLEFEDWDGTVLQTADYDYGTDLSAVTAPSDPNRTGYTFTGWDTSIPLTMPANNVTITAQYTINQYTLEFVDWDGTVLQTADYNYGTDLSAVTAPSDPIRTGYTFTGWDTSIPLTMPANNVTITAQYTIKQFTLEFVDWDGTVLQTADYNYGTDLSAVTAPSDPSRTGYTFTGWDSNIPATMPANDVTITATYTINQYTISFQSNGGTSVSDITQNYNTAVSQPSNPTKTGYTFGGWYSDAGLTQSYTFTTMPASNITLYAKWIVIQYTLEFEDWDGTILQTADYDYGTDLSAVTAPSDPSRTGYTFTGWDTSIPLTMPANNVTITAQYTINQYTLEFVDWDGTVLQTADYNYGTDLSAVTAPSDPSRTGYTFTGWDSNIPATMPANDVTITATYTINQYTISFQSNGGTSVSDITQNYNTAVSQPSNPTKTGYTFNGWYSDAGLTQSYTFTTMPAQNITLYAKWTINQYTITFNSNGGSVVSAITQDYGTVVTQPTNPTKVGYTFNGWYSDSGLTQSYTFTTMPASNITLYAKWIVIQYTLEFVDWDGTVLQTADYDYGTDLSAVTAPSDPNRTGYTFIGWDTSIPLTMPANNVTITAQYTINQYTLEFVNWDGTVLQTADYNYGTDLSAVTAPSDPNRTGYTFTGWDTSIPLTMPANNVTITAQYTIKQFTLEFVDWDGSILQTTDYDYATDLSGVTISNPTRTGYTFAGWDISVPATMPANDVTITATYTINQYTISFQSNGGTSVSDITQNYNTAVSQPSNPTKTGYTFNGWYSDAGLTQSYTFTTMPAQNITLYAKWTINQYTITFNSNGGSVVSAITQDYGTVVTQPTNPTKVGYTFNGWYSDSGLTQSYTFTTMPASNITLYAKWIVIQYTLEFVDWDGTVLQTAEYNYGTDLGAVTAPADPSRTGYTFTGWDIPIPTTMPASDVTITAQYTINQYTLEFVNWDGSILQTTTHDYMADLSGVSAPINPSRTGYSFTGWDIPIPANMPASDVTITAQFSINQYTISFEENGGTGVSDITQNYGTVVTQPTNPTRIGYTFSGWFTDDVTFLNEYIFTTMPANNITLYAKWTINQYTITFNSNGGSSVTPITQNYGTVVTQPANPTKAGYTFGGWYSDADLTQSYTFSTMPANNITLYAKWITNGYLLEFVDWDGTILSSTSYSFGDDLSGVSYPTDPTRIGYTFTGWDIPIPATMPANNVTITAQYTINQYTLEFVDWDGTILQTADYDYGTDLSAVTAPIDPSRTGYTFTGWDIPIPATMPANDVTITATYSINQYTISFEENGGSLVTDITQNYGTVVSQPTNPTRTGYTFNGWFTDNGTFLNEYTFTTMPASNITLYAKWTINQYTITFNSNGGTLVSPITQDYGTVVTQPVDPTKFASTFNGWYIDAALTTPYTFTTMPAQNITLYAGWTINQYTLEFVDWDGTILQSANYNYGADLSGVTAPIDPSRIGYTFTGWDLSIPLTMPANNVTITAQYTINQYTLVFVDWDGTILQSANYNYGADLSGVTAPANPTRIGYTFTGWDIPIPATMPANNVTITAQYNINQYTITFVSNGGSIVNPITQDYGTVVSAPANPTRAGYTFNGWFTDDVTFLNEYVFTTMPANNVTLYAKWTVLQYKIEYRDFDGTVLQSSLHDTDSDISGVTAPTDPSRTGYTFTGWDVSLPPVMPPNDIILIAQYTINQYTLEFVDWDGTILQSANYNYGADLSGVTAPANPTRIGYTFTGWDIPIPATMPANNVTITAQYTINQYTITFVSNGGTAVTSITQDYGTIVTAPTDPTRTGYTFDGWYSDIALTTPYTFSTMPAQNITLYAAWLIQGYTITFDSNGGTAVSPIVAPEGQAITAPPDPTKTGFFFAGWYTDNGTFTNEYTFITMPPANLTLYARWLDETAYANELYLYIEQMVLNNEFINLEIPTGTDAEKLALLDAMALEIQDLFPGSLVSIKNPKINKDGTITFRIEARIGGTLENYRNITATFIVV
ncbi:InlB B-repeat-containing protein [Candidatus Izemoplasma sp. B36]|uniref:InlB B-repeat-containing protein n=1 Tax=Candidatus Izemoplasma sp. B36 TaxID=3242468 RepID=UPI00355821ED